MKILVFTPTWIDPDLGIEAIHPKCEASIKAQRFDDAWASHDFDWCCRSENRYPVPDHRNVLEQYRWARDYFLCTAGWDALLTIEHDHVLPDERALQRMIETPGDIVYAPYLLRHNSRPDLNTFRYVGREVLGESLSLYPDELQQARAAIVWKISGAGMGCTLFRRHVLEAIEFSATDDRNPCPDLSFAKAVLQAGFESVGRFDVPVDHYSRGKWLRPFEDG